MDRKGFSAVVVHSDLAWLTDACERFWCSLISFSCQVVQRKLPEDPPVAIKTSCCPVRWFIHRHPAEVCRANKKWSLRSPQQEVWQAGLMPSALSLWRHDNTLQTFVFIKTAIFSPSSQWENICSRRDRNTAANNSPVLIQMHFTKYYFYIFVVPRMTKEKKTEDALQKTCKNISSVVKHVKININITLVPWSKISLLQLYW